MHTVHLGICQWLNASAILDLCDIGFFKGKTLAEQLVSLTHAFNRWCKVNSIEPLVLPSIYIRCHFLVLIGIIDFLGGWEGKECNDLSQTRHYQHSFPVSLLGISSRDYPELKLKAYTNRVMTSFLAVCLQEACNKFEESERPPRLVLACASMQKLNEWLLRIEMTQRYMTQKEADDIYNLCFE
jgi:hypothetical protein